MTMGAAACVGDVADPGENPNPNPNGNTPGAQNAQKLYEDNVFPIVQANCGGCPRLPIWSNPDVLIRGVPAGSVGHDNARVIAENGLRVAAFR